MTPFSLPVRVYIEDTDAGGIVYYVNYLKFAERARTEFMRAAGFKKAAIFDEQLMFVVSAMTVKYLQAAKLDDELQVTASVAEVAKVSLTFDQEVYRGADKLFAAQVQIACVDRTTLKPRRIPATLLDAIAAPSHQGS